MKAFRTITSLIFVLFVLTLLPACSGTPRPVIQDITHSPEFPREGEEVKFIISYANTDTANSYKDVKLHIIFSEFLEFMDADARFVDFNPEERQIFFQFGDMAPQDSGDLVLVFRVARNFPLEINELPVEAILTGIGPDEQESSSSRIEISGLVGHPTSTPQPTDTSAPPTNEPGAQPQLQADLDQPSIYQLSQVPPSTLVMVSLPQEQQQTLRIEESFFDPGLMARPVIGQYALLREVTNFYVKDELGNPVNEFSQDDPLIITVSFTEQDVADAGGSADNLALMVFIENLEGGQWEAYPTAINLQEMTGTIKVYSWNSHICWGRRSLN